MHNLVRSDDLSSLKDVYATERLVSGSKIILCTLSTLSNPALESCQMFKVVPMMKLVIDEASQINVFEFMVRLNLCSLHWTTMLTLSRSSIYSTSSRTCRKCASLGTLSNVSLLRLSVVLLLN